MAEKKAAAAKKSTGEKERGKENPQRMAEIYGGAEKGSLYGERGLQEIYFGLQDREGVCG